MTVHQNNLSNIKLGSFADESKRIYLFQVQICDKTMAETLKLSIADDQNLWTCFRCQAMFRQEIHLHYYQNI